MGGKRGVVFYKLAILLLQYYCVRSMLIHVNKTYLYGGASHSDRKGSDFQEIETSNYFSEKVNEHQK